MKREIKFRAWREWDRRIVYDDVICCLSFNEDGTVNECSSVAMQFTGLRDKNGKEIYEGDIIDMRYDTDPADEHLYVPVEYHDAAFWAGAVWLLEDYDEVRGVVGNIYENPELLTK